MSFFNPFGSSSSGGGEIDAGELAMVKQNLNSLEERVKIIEDTPEEAKKIFTEDDTK